MTDSEKGAGRDAFAVPAASRATLTALVKTWLSLSNRQARELIERGGVAVDGVVVSDPVHRPRAGARLTAREPLARRPRTIRGPGFRSVHLDRDLVVVDKDPGVVVVPTGRDDDDDPALVARVASALAIAGHRSDPLWVVHRIDRATSGLVLLARTEAASRTLEAQFSRREPRRVYLCWCEGVPEPRQGRLVHRLAEDPRTHRVEVVSADRRAQEAALRYDVEASADHETAEVSRVRVELVTGRRNQIRAQFAAEGWALLGDRWYSPHDLDAPDEPLGRLCPRAALHAHQLGFRHPRTGEPLSLVAPLPADLLRLDRRLFDRGSRAESRS